MVNIKDIVESELCVGCGLCVSESDDGKMVWNKYGFLVPDVQTTFNKNAIKVCPFNPNPEDPVQDEDKLADLFLTDADRVNNRIGKYINTYVGFANEFRRTSSSGGIATYVFEQLLKRKIVDYLYVVKETNGSYAYQLVRSTDDIKKISKTRYIPVTLADLFTQINELDGKIALSGVACFIKAVRLKQYYHPELKNKIPFLVGIICGGLKSRFFTDYLAKSAGVEGEYRKQDYRIKDERSTASNYSFGTYSIDNLQEIKTVRMQKLGDMWGSGLFKSNACDFCTDVTTELADISLGDAWLEPYYSDGMGTSVVVTRSELANRLIVEGVEDNSLKVEELAFERFFSSQQGSFNHRQLGLKYRYNKKKKTGIVPHVRSRFLESISFDFKVVQKLRLKIRALSLEVWLSSDNADTFEKVMKHDRERLRKASIFNHRLKRVKKMLGF